MRVEVSSASAVEKSHGWSRKAVLLAKYRQSNALEAAGLRLRGMAASRAEDLAVGQYLAIRHKSEVRDR